MSDNIYQQGHGRKKRTSRDNNTRYERKTKEDKPVIAICYDFDKTLSPMNMQEGYIKSLGLDVNSFWKKSNDFARRNDMDQNLSYMYQMMEESQGKKILNRDVLRKYGEKLELFPGVEGWFERIREYGKSKGIIIEHYIISSGLREMIEGTRPAQQNAFEKIYASSFYYDKKGVAKWPAQVINYTGKTQFLFRIEKGVLNINDQGVNDYFPADKRRVPFRNMIYIGDSDTDIPCMKVVSSYGGHSIGVYSAETKDKTKVYQMIRDNRINYFAPADYSGGTELDLLVKKIIDKTATNERLEEEHYKYAKEVRDADRTIGEEQKRKYHLINRLEDSEGFISSDAVIYEMQKISTWTDQEIERICSIAWKNIQVEIVLGESYIADFFKDIIDQYYRRNNRYGKYTKQIKNLLDDTDS